MPLVLPLSLTTVSSEVDTNYIISAAYNFVGDPVSAQNLNGVSFNGSLFTFDTSIVGQNIKLPRFKTLQLSCTFDNSNGDNFDGELIVLVQGTNQMFRFGSTTLVEGSPVQSVLNAIVPLVANSPVKILFAKGVDSTAAMFGMLNVNVYSWKIPPMFSLGVAAN